VSFCHPVISPLLSSLIPKEFMLFEVVVRFGLANHLQQWPRNSVENYANRQTVICLTELQLSISFTITINS
jgi:hypothetical protein